VGLCLCLDSSKVGIFEQEKYTEYDDESLDIQRSRLNIVVLMIEERVWEKKNLGLSLINTNDVVEWSKVWKSF
jgi:hypothetical protein